ncbi:NAD-dependent epimerase/dehydratase family protein [Candidatus Omnitrophota bacterium]
MKALITGATGFLGTHLVSKLLDKGIEVVGMDKDDFYFQKYLAKKIKLYKFDVRNISSHAHHFKGIDVVIHCASALHDSPPEEIYSVNLEGTKNTLELCLHNRIPKFIYCSSTVVYGYFEHKPPVYEDSPLLPQHPYAISKVKSEKLAIEYRNRGVNTCIVRPKSFTGKGRLGVFQLLCDWIYHGARIPIIGNGNNRFQLLGVSDLVEGMYQMAVLPIENEIINLGTDKFGMVKEDVADLVTYANTGSSLLFVPATPVKIALRIIGKLKLTQMWSWHYETADRDSYVEISKAQRLINWKPVQSNVDILKETFDWYKDNINEFKNNVGYGHHGVIWRERLLSFVRDILKTKLRNSDKKRDVT